MRTVLWQFHHPNSKDKQNDKIPEFSLQSQQYPFRVMASMSSQPSTARPIWARKSDLFYIVALSFVIFLALSASFFPSAHLSLLYCNSPLSPPGGGGVTTAIDLIDLYPISPPTWFRSFHTYFIANYNDPLYAKNPPFFRLYLLIEAFCSIPASLWCIRGLIRGKYFSTRCCFCVFCSEQSTVANDFRGWQRR